jgi:hypothetical protein
MSDITLNYDKTFTEASVEWTITGEIVGNPKLRRDILLHKVWLSTDILQADKLSNPNDASYPSEQGIARLIDHSTYGKTYVRAVLPSEINDYHTRESLVEDLMDRANSFLNDTGGHRPFSGYFFFLESTLTNNFMNYDMLEECANSINFVAKSHSKTFPGVDTISYPVNSSVYYTYPERLTVGGQSVVGARAGDVIKFRSEGGSGDYSAIVTEGSHFVDLQKSRVRIIKDISGVAVISVTDLRDPGAPPSTITINIEGII